MKKIFALALVLLFATVVSSLADTQAPTATDNGKSIYGRVDAHPTATTDANAVMIGKCSKGVYAGWNTSATEYVIITMHQSGNRSFGSSFDATAIYRNDTLVAEAPNLSTSSYFGSAWTSM